MDINQKIVNACQRLASTDDAIMYYVQTKATPEERFNALKNLSWKTVENYIYNVIDMNDLVEAIFSNFDDGKSYTIEEISDIINKNKDEILEDVKQHAEDFLNENHDNKYFFANSCEVNDLSDNDDSVGDTFVLAGDEPDLMNRKAAFADIEGEIIISKNSESHGQMINRYIKEKTDMDDTRNNVMYRPEEKDMNNFDVNSYSFGHIVDGNVWIIDSVDTYNMSVEDVVKDIEESGNTCSKIYVLNAYESYYGESFTRLAKKCR